MQVGICRCLPKKGLTRGLLRLDDGTSSNAGPYLCPSYGSRVSRRTFCIHRILVFVGRIFVKYIEIAFFTPRLFEFLHFASDPDWDTLIVGTKTCRWHSVRRLVDQLRTLGLSNGMFDDSTCSLLANAESSCRRSSVP